ncbi:MAG: hypothetical protein IKI03_09020 [Clostridia bacterium]|nr:hypothetical protein [Clostridia bacterium]
MKIKKRIKLINDEHSGYLVRSSKGCVTDTCPVAKDYAHCDVYSTDVCKIKDLAACINSSHDYCGTGYDTVPCFTGGYDYD